MGLLDPTPPPYDALEWARRPLPEKARLVCQAWAMQGYGTPAPAYIAYLLKVGLYVGGWLFFCSFSERLGPVTAVAEWWLRPEAFEKAILWSMLFEVLGLGCGSGPLTGRYFPPFGGALYFLNPGTTKSPLFPGAPLIGRPKRGWLEVVLYLALVVSLVHALGASTVETPMLVPIVALVPILGLLDKTVFLAARSEHYWITAVVFLFAVDWVPGAKLAQAALWFWAGVSKLNRHFPPVVCVMNSNSPFTRLESVRRRFYRNYPDDLRPSALATQLSHFGTALELSVPIVLLAGDGGTVTTVGLIMMIALHAFITSTVPMGVPIEWNVMVVYGAFFLFGENASVSTLSMEPTWLYGPLVTVSFALPLLGNFRPHWVSFLLSMRYYAGNWACSVWFFRGESYRRLDKLRKPSRWIHDQLAMFYDRRTTVGLVGKVIAFRLMHLHGRALALLVPKAMDNPDAYEWIDGELVAGMVIGWNFGDGHLHDERLLDAVQRQCAFEPGELRCIFVESQPLLNPTLRYRIHDAYTGEMEHGEVSIDDIIDRQPWDIAYRTTPAPS